MARVLGLTSPMMTGADVLALQKALKQNAFDKNFMPDGKADGTFGDWTAQGCYRAQYWLGYATPTRKAGTPLVAYLRGTRPLPKANRERRAARIRKAEADKPMRVKAFEEAARHVGVKESPPGSNRQKFGEWYGWNGVAWCAMFVSYCYAAAGSKSVAKRLRWAYCPYMVADAKAGRNGLALTRSPQRGDVVLFSKPVAKHVELFDEWVVEGKTFATIGGNTSPNDMANGGMVYHYGKGGRPVRKVSDVNCFVHVGR